MQGRINLSIAVLASAILLAAATPGMACTCAIRQPGPSTASPDEVVFEGVVKAQAAVPGGLATVDALSNSGSGQHRAVTFVVGRVREGTLARQIMVETGTGNGDCGYDFLTGQRYYVVAHRVASGVLTTDICSGTRVLRPATPARLCGHVSLPNGKPLAGALLYLMEADPDPFPENLAEDASNPQGDFCLERLPPGRYRLGAERWDYDAERMYHAYYPGTLQYGKAAVLRLRPGASITGLSVRTRTEPTFGVWIQLTSPAGTTVDWTEFTVTVFGTTGGPLAYKVTAPVNTQGLRGLSGLTPGTYRISYQWRAVAHAANSDPAQRWLQRTRTLKLRGERTIVLPLAPAARLDH